MPRARNPLVPVSGAKNLEIRICELERLLRKKTVEVEILRDALEIADEGKLRSRISLLE